MRPRTRTPEPVDREQGFTLIEMVVAMAILLVASVAVFTAFGATSKQVASIQGMVEEQADSRNVLSGLTSELRNSFTGDKTLNRIESISATSVVFYTADRSTPMKLVKVSYDVSGGSLRRSAVTSTNASPTLPWTFPAGTPTMIPVLPGVTNATVFVFKDTDGNVLPYTAASTAKVELVEVTLAVRDPRATSTQKIETYTTAVKLRGVL